MAYTNTQQNLQTCLEFIDQRLEKGPEQTFRIAEMIIEDIKQLTKAYPDALRHGDLAQHLERVRKTQMNWVNQLHDLIQQQENLDLNREVMSSMYHFVNTLNQNTLKSVHFELPSALQSQAAHEPLEPQERDLLLGQGSLFEADNLH
ncbi:hypothetical protein [Thiomicrorhabdus cannonii]|uniref:hypothetical protein n=1 Tax=Thiomicrorhabdus cannonii TaxID=2748011 RepID=UPI0015BEBED4|nr:hypothetical protein [Thiomicrorhabdus cannonii]